jgi:hypothetical protein
VLSVLPIKSSRPTAIISTLTTALRVPVQLKTNVSRDSLP